MKTSAKYLNLFLSLILILMSSLSIHAQSKMDKRKEKMKALKIAYITEELDLSTEQWQIFWPIYNAFHSKDYHEQKELLNTQFIENPAAAEEVLSNLMQLESEELNRKHQYMEKMQEALGAGVVLKLSQLEHKFKERLLRKFKERGKRKGL